MKSSLLLLIGLYKAVAAVHLGGACRFEPSCSCYAVDAAKTHRPLTAVRLIVIRILKCRPGGPWGYDPVPPAVTEKYRCNHGPSDDNLKFRAGPFRADLRGNS